MSRSDHSGATFSKISARMPEEADAWWVKYSHSLNVSSEQGLIDIPQSAGSE